jgi:MOSC domain-containing protein YiiM
VVGLQIAKASRLDMVSVDAIEIETAAGIVGDRYHGSRHRQVSVQSATELAEAAEKFGSPIDPLMTRRNITIDVGPVPITPGHRWSIGDVELEVVRIAAPCRLLEDELGRGAKDALRRRAGVICRVLAGGSIRIGDSVDL